MSKKSHSDELHKAIVLHQALLIPPEKNDDNEEFPALFAHSGETLGSGAQIIWEPSLGLGITILINTRIAKNLEISMQKLMSSMLATPEAIISEPILEEAGLSDPIISNIFGYLPSAKFTP